MRCCTKAPSIIYALTLALLCLSTFSYAEGIVVAKAESRLSEEGYELIADYKITLPPSVEMALNRGVTLNFVSEIKVTRSRWYWLDTVVMKDEQTTKLSYSALTRQYRISRGTLFRGYPSLESALAVLGHQTAPLLPASALSGWGGYVARVLKSPIKYEAFAHMRLDVSQLPKPLQVSALTNGDWNLESEPYSWPISTEIPQSDEVRMP